MTRMIYLSGGMQNLSFEDSNDWRKCISDELKYDAYVFNPNDYASLIDGKPTSEDEKEAFRFDIHKLRTADVVIVNFNDPNSIGTAQEIALAYEWNKPIIGLNEKSNEIHPWLQIEVGKVFSDIYELIEYVKMYYLV